MPKMKKKILGKGVRSRGVVIRESGQCLVSCFQNNSSFINQEKVHKAYAKKNKANTKPTPMQRTNNQAQTQKT